MPILRLPKHPPKRPRRLTAAQKRFAHDVASGMRATDAFLSAWPHAARWNRRKVRTQAERLVRNHTGIGAYIEQHLRRLLESRATIAGLTH